MMSKLLSKLLLLPCSKVYGMAVGVRNKLFDWGILKQIEFEVPVVVVGNLAVGGTGKTPHVEYIAGAFRHSHHIAILSRGYKRATKGFVLADRRSTPRDIGDEAYQIYHKFGGTVTVAVCEDRVAGIRRLLESDPKINLVLLDDAFQHRYVKPRLSIVVSEYKRPVYRDNLLPYGRLRESRIGLNRADVVIVSKCPESLRPIDYRVTRDNYKLMAFQHLFFSKFAYRTLKPVFADSATSIPYLEWLTTGDSLLAISGIGNPRPFVRYLKSFKAVVKVDVFPDHHNYTRRDIEHILARYRMLKGKHRIIVTTEKDAVRLANNPYYPAELKPVTFFLPIEVEFTANSDTTLTDVIKKAIKS